MSKRRVEIEPEVESESKVQQTIADSKSNVVFMITIICVRCSRIHSLLLHSKEMPEWAREFLLTVPWDSPNEVFTEAARSKKSDKNKAAIKRALQLQLLCEPAEVWSGKKLVVNKCLAPESILQNLQEDHPNEKIEPGLLHALNQKHIAASMGQVISGYGELISAEPKFIAGNTILSTGRISIMEHWRDELTTKKK